jgi:hypothetical protein
MVRTACASGLDEAMVLQATVEQLRKDLRSEEASCCRRSGAGRL